MSTVGVTTVLRQYNDMIFKAWMQKVNGILATTCGLTSDDLGDIAYHDLFDSGVSPKEAAEECLTENGFPFGEE